MPTLPRLAYLTSLYPAASHTFILREVTALRDLGFEVETCSMRRPDDTHMIGAEEQAARENTFYIVEAGKSPKTILQALGSALGRPRAFLDTLQLAFRTAPPGLKGGLKQLFYLAEAIILARHLRNHKAMHLHNHFADPSANVAMLTSALSGIPFSYTLHGPAELYEPEKWHLRIKTQRARFVACISHFARSQAMYFSDPSDWHKLHIIHCGVRPDRYVRAVDKPKTGKDLVFVGRLTAIKGLRVLMEAFALARAQVPDLTLTFVGDGDDKEHLRLLATPFGDAVRFAGFLSQDAVAEALAQSDMLVLPSFAEGLPVVLMEALASGTPVICTQVAGVGELVEHGVSGFCVPAGDAETLAARIITLAEDADLRVRMGAAGRAKVLAEFEIDQEAARIAHLFADPDTADIRPQPMQASS